MLTSKYTFTRNIMAARQILNLWDFLALVVILAILFFLGLGAKEMAGPFHLGQTIPISLDPRYLPYYALRTVLRMFLALVISVIFTFIFGTWAAKSRYAERLIIPTIDILQSVPILGFLTITIVGFIHLFPGSLLGPELAAIFAIFTAQVWNMALSLYQSLRTIPDDLIEVANILHLSAWQRFWRVEVPFALPGLLWNTMVSLSSSWVFLVAAEAISVANQNITLPGIGSYIALAISQSNMKAVFYVIITMLIVIVIYNQLLFNPLIAWSEKFKFEPVGPEGEFESWVLNLLLRTHFFRQSVHYISIVGDAFVNFKPFLRRQKTELLIKTNGMYKIFWFVLLGLILGWSGVFLIKYIMSHVSYAEIAHTFYLGLITAIRVMILIVISSLIWVPIGVWAGLNPKMSRIIQPVALFLAAFPANLLFPLVVWMLIHYQLNVNIWVSPLMILGPQWYLLFNIIAGTSAIPKSLHHVAKSFNLKGMLWWKRLMLPSVFPYYITGAITAGGGAWNMSIIAEAVSWGHVHVQVVGLGAYIAQVSAVGDFPRLALGIAVMSLYVLAIDHFIWKPLYKLTQERFKLT